MKFSWKIFIAAFLTIVCSFGIGGFVLINLVFESSLDRIVDSSLSENKLMCISLNALMSNTEIPFFDYNLSNFTKQLSEQNRVIVDDKGDVRFYNENHFINGLNVDEQGYKLISTKGGKYIQAISCINVDDRMLYVESVFDISDIYFQRKYQYGVYRAVLLCVAMIGSVIIMIFAHFVTKPLKNLTKTAEEIADGKYDMRVKPQKHGSSEEVEKLTNNFNIMAQNVEEYILYLKNEAKRQEDFVGNFTHELKTPLTSIIGYADMLRSCDLPQDKRRMSADYIYREGKRLESLSLHLLNMIVVRNKDIELVNKQADDFFNDIKKSLYFTMEKYGLLLSVSAESACLKIEPMLIKTVILNLAENACKASEKGQTVTIMGALKNGKYLVSVMDNGCGISQEELPRITEAFYMVDKSRARAKGSAGLGLALCKEILSLHNTEMKIVSTPDKGTTVSFALEVISGER